MSKTRAERLEAFEEWADRVEPGELKVAGRSQELVDLLDEGCEATAEALDETGGMRLVAHRSA